MSEATKVVTATQMGLWQGTAIVTKEKAAFAAANILDPKDATKVIGEKFALRKRKDIADALGVANTKDNRITIDNHLDGEKREAFRLMKLRINSLKEDEFGGVGMSARRGKDGLWNLNFRLKELQKRGKWTEEEEVAHLNYYGLKIDGQPVTIESLRRKRAEQEAKQNATDIESAPVDPKQLPAGTPAAAPAAASQNAGGQPAKK